jgi:hypothetical protein
MAPAHGVGVVVLTNREEDALWPALRVLAALLGRGIARPFERTHRPVRQRPRDRSGPS